jgi:hypothetical protein
MRTAEVTSLDPRAGVPAALGSGGIADAPAPAADDDAGAMMDAARGGSGGATCCK